MNPVERYFQALTDIHATRAGVPETSYYGALESLLNEIGSTLKPKVRCVVNIANRGAGNPDGGLFTASQFRKVSNPESAFGQLPERGVIEIKSAREDAWVIAEGEQVSRYWGRYGLVLVTNYRDFVLIGKDNNGRPAKMETYRLAESEAAFWAMATQPRAAATLHGTLLTEYLKRVMLHSAPLATPQDVAWFLASYARDAKARVENVDLPALARIRQALEEALGLKFEGEKGEHFFRSTLIQTLFYGIFSAWVLWSKERSPNDKTSVFDWRTAAWSLRVPMISVLFDQISAPVRIQRLGLVEPLDWTAAVLSRVDRSAFFSIFDQGWAVQYFYEPFLEQFDPELRKELGVWYTPPEIVKYMVARVDAVLREQLGIEDGLADPRVFVLDPCCGTGTYLIEVLRHIASTLKEKGEDALIAQEVKKAALSRVFGFEILPAPFVISHLQLGLLLQQLQAPLSPVARERVAVYLTNALTGWVPPAGPKQQLLFPEMEEERDAAEEIKREKPILVILGNPPYNAFAGVSPAEEDGLVESYKVGLNAPALEGGWGIKKFNLDDLYVRFFRLAERRIAEGKPGRGIISFVSNFSYLRDSSFVVMRGRLLNEFDEMWFDCMNGDSRETGKLTPEGKPDPSVFSTEYHPVGIRVGTAICLMVRKGTVDAQTTVRFRNLWGVTKRADLLASLSSIRFDALYELLSPNRANRYSFRPSKLTGTYASWPRVLDLCREAPINGVMEKRAGALIDIDRSKVEARMRAYYDDEVDWNELVGLVPGLTRNAARFAAKTVRQKVLSAEQFQLDRIRRYAIRPYDNRWCYYSEVNPLWNTPRPVLWAQYRRGNAFLVTRPAAVASPEGAPAFYTTLFGDNDFLRGHAYYVPFWIYSKSAEVSGVPDSTSSSVAKHSPKRRPNLSASARNYLKSIGLEHTSKTDEAAALVWFHSLAICFSPSYRSENADGLRHDWPRIPMPKSAEMLEASSKVGAIIAGLLESDSKVVGVNIGTVRAELRTIAVVAKVGGGVINPDIGELKVGVGWGHFGKERAVMPGKGRLVEREYTPEELVMIRDGASIHGLSQDETMQQLGPNTRDVYLNDVAFWKNIPSGVWEYTIGGYQVIKKWLSYREFGILGRALSMEEVREVTNIARRLATILLLQPTLDANYREVGVSAVQWSSIATSNGPLAAWARLGESASAGWNESS